VVVQKSMNSLLNALLGRLLNPGGIRGTAPPSWKIQGMMSLLLRLPNSRQIFRTSRRQSVKTLAIPETHGLGYSWL
jgi:hypothetical protein